MDTSLNLAEFVIGNTEFSAEVYKEFVKTTNGNILVCPLSAQIILALCHTGAKGKTAEELSRALYLPENPEDITKALNELQACFRSNYFTMNSANKIYIQNGYKIIEEFKKIALEKFFAEIQNIDFAQKQTTAEEINKWVETKSNDKIKNIIDAKELDGDVFAILINAMYFQGVWVNKFKKDCTSKQPFYLANGDEIEVDTMWKGGYFDYYEDAKLEAKFLNLHYSGMVATMTFILPNARDGLVKLENHMSTVLVTPKFSTERVDIAIPKFKIGMDIKFVPILQALGVVEAFKSSADFSGIIANLPLEISDVIQKTFIDLQEDGTTAAAATCVKMKKGCCAGEELELHPKSFIADHPFIFILKIKDVIVFVGKCNKPTY